MSTLSRWCAVRDAGSPSRLGKVHKTYPYTLDALLQMLEEARLRSFNEGPQVITVVTGRSSQGEILRQGQPGFSGERVHVVANRDQVPEKCSESPITNGWQV